MNASRILQALGTPPAETPPPERLPEKSLTPEPRVVPAQPADALALRRVLVAVDGSPESEAGVPWGVLAASALGAQLTIVRCLEPGSLASGLPGPDALSWELARAMAMRYLEDLRERASTAGSLPSDSIELRLEEGHAASRILTLARGSDVDLVVLGRHGEHGRRSDAPSGTALEVAERNSAATLLVPYNAEGLDRIQLPRRILVFLDGSQRAEHALGPALRLAARAGSELLLLHVLPQVELFGSATATPEDIELAERVRQRNRRAADEYFGHLRDRLASSQVAVHPHVREESFDELVHRPPEALDADLAVLCAHGATVSSHCTLGRVVRHAMQLLQRPLLIVQDFSAREVERCTGGPPRMANHTRLANAPSRAQV